MSQINNPGDSVSLHVHATDSVGTASVTYSAAGLPSALSINASTGLITGTISPTDANLVAITPTITASDGVSTASQIFTWTINSPISIVGIATLQNNVGDVVSYHVKVSDSTTSASLTFSALNLPLSLSINASTGLISGTIAAIAGNFASFSPVILVTDGTANANASFTWNVTSPISVVGLPMLQNNDGDSVFYQVKAYDSSGGSLSYHAENLPAGLSINISTGVISGTIAPGDSNGQSLAPIIVVNDASSMVSTGLIWNINSPISLVDIATLQNNEGDVVSVHIMASDSSSGATMNFNAADLPTGLSINTSSGVISGTVASGASNLGAFTPVITVGDGHATASETLAWNVNSPITLVGLDTLQNNEGDVVSVNVKAADSASGATLSYTAAGLPTGLAINLTTGVISGTIATGASNLGSFTPTITVSDGTRTASETFSWNINAPLTLVGLDTLQNNEGDVVSVHVKAADTRSGVTLLYTAAGLPTGLAINLTTGVISGTIASGASNLGSFTPTITVTESTVTATETFSWNVSSPITLVGIDTLQNNEGDVVSVHIKASDSTPSASLLYKAMDLPPGLAINSSTGVITGTINAGSANLGGVYYPVISATDGTATAMEGFTWNVNSPITLVGIDTLQNNEGDVVSLHIKAADSATGATLTYAAAGLPTGLAINATTGVITGTIAPGAANQGGVYSPVITVSDGTLTASETFTWNVNSPITLVDIDTLQNNEGDVVSVHLKAADSTPSASLTYAAAGLPNGLSINISTGVITGTIAAGAADLGAAYYPEITVSDVTAVATEGFTRNVNSPITLVGIDTLQNNEGDVVSIHIKATDSTSGSTLFFAATGLPNGLAINTTTGVITGTIAAGTADQGGSYSPVITVTDGTAVNSESFTWNVNSPITLVGIDTLQNNEGDVVSIHIKATDSSTSVSLNYAAAGLPNGLAINSSTGVITGTIAAGAADLGGSYSPEITVSDGTATATEGFTWNVNSPITLVALNTLQNNEGDVVSIHIKATDSTSGSTASYAATGLPNGLSINSSTGVITGTVASGSSNSGAFSPVITVTDGTAVASEEFTWNINSPITIAAIADQQSTEGAVVSLSILASDSTSGVTLKYAATGLPNGLSVNVSTGLISGTIAAGTANLGEAYSPVITVSDGTAVATLGFNWNVASAITIGGITTQRSSVGSAASVTVTATDANSLALTYSAEGLPPGLAINVSTGVISGTIATGAANISTVYSPLITVTDGTAVATQGFTWNLASPISITGLFTQNSSEGSVVSLSVVATDANSLALTYAAMGLPNGLTINTSTGVIAGTIAAGAANAGAVTPVITVTDGTSTASENFTWNLSSAISLGTIPTQTSSEGSVVSVSFTVSNGNSLSVTLSAEGLPAGVSLNHTTGLITGTIAAGAADNGVAYPVITATDGTSTANESLTWNLSSAITLGTIATQSNTEGNSVSLSLSATDANSLPVTFSAVGLPAGISLNETSGVISGTIAAGAAANGPAYPVITATDGTAVTSESFTWNLSSAISIGTISPLVSTSGSSVSVSVTATDAYSLALTYSASGLPDGVNINSSTGLISGTVAANASSGASLTPVITISDATTSNSISLTWSIGPAVADDSFNTQENTALTVAASIGVLSVDSAPAGTTLTATLLTTTSDGTLSLASNGSFVYTPNSNWTGTDSFTYAASDGSVTSTPVTVTIETDLTLSQANNNFVAVATGDFNGDGNQDFVAANNSTNAISVFLGNGDGTFQTPTVISVGTGPDALAVGNFGNNAEDIAVVNGTAGTVTILMNNGTGTFTATQTLTVGTDPVSLALGDFEGNGHLDLAVANEGSNTISVFLNNGTGTFTLDTTITVGTSPSSVAAGDMNKDGYCDLVVANSGSNNISVLLSNGNGTFATAVNYSVGTSPSAVVVADLNGDGVMDVAVANSGSGTVSVFLGSGNGTLGTASNYTVGSDPVALATGDVTGDGNNDLAVINHSSNNETVLSNNGSGGFTANETIALGESCDSVALADFANAGVANEIVDAMIQSPKPKPPEVPIVKPITIDGNIYGDWIISQKKQCRPQVHKTIWQLCNHYFSARSKRCQCNKNWFCPNCKNARSKTRYTLCRDRESEN